jgi:hypothetical protein
MPASSANFIIRERDGLPSIATTCYIQDASVPLQRSRS